MAGKDKFSENSQLFSQTVLMDLIALPDIPSHHRHCTKVSYQVNIGDLFWSNQHQRYTPHSSRTMNKIDNKPF